MPLSWPECNSAKVTPLKSAGGLVVSVLLQCRGRMRQYCVQTNIGSPRKLQCDRGNSNKNISVANEIRLLRTRQRYTRSISLGSCRRGESDRLQILRCARWSAYTTWNTNQKYPVPSDLNRSNCSEPAYGSRDVALKQRCDSLLGFVLLGLQMSSCKLTILRRVTHYMREVTGIME